MRVVELRTDCEPERRSELNAVLGADPFWAAYAIADLQPGYAPYCRWYIAENAQAKGLVMRFKRLSPPALFAIGDRDAVDAALERAATTDLVYMTLREEDYRLAGRYYDFSADRRPMWRMRLVDPEASTLGTELTGGTQIVRLGPEDSQRIRSLYAHGGPFAPDAFGPYQAEDGTFFGAVDAGGDLLATGGTHIVDWEAGIGAIGNMYTHPRHRGQGLGAAILRAIVGRLLDGGVATIVLNVDQRNDAAKSLYVRHGFAVHCPYLEGIGRRRKSGKQSSQKQ